MDHSVPDQQDPTQDPPSIKIGWIQNSSFLQYRAEDTSDTDEEEEPDRELIRRKLAQDGSLQDNSLLVCFMNESESTSESDNEERKTTAFARANISRRKEHVIIPINSVEDFAVPDLVQENPLFASDPEDLDSEAAATATVVLDETSAAKLPVEEQRRVFRTVGRHPSRGSTKAQGSSVQRLRRHQQRPEEQGHQDANHPSVGISGRLHSGQHAQTQPPHPDTDERGAVAVDSELFFVANRDSE